MSLLAERDVKINALTAEIAALNARPDADDLKAKLLELTAGVQNESTARGLAQLNDVSGLPMQGGVISADFK